MAALWLLGVSVALLIVAVHCIPIKQGPFPVPFYGVRENAAPGSNRDANFNVNAPEAGGYDLALANSRLPQGSPGYNVPSGAPASSSGTEAAVLFPSPSGSEASRSPMMPGPVFPPQHNYQAGQLSRVDMSQEFGDRQTEREENFESPPLPVPQISDWSSPALTSMPAPAAGLGIGWGPYPYYDYMFLTGQYPPGTLTYSSNTLNQGRDYLNEIRYRRSYLPPMQYTQYPLSMPKLHPRAVATSS